MKKYIKNLRQEYFKPSAPSLVVALMMPVVVLAELEPLLTRKLQPVVGEFSSVLSFAKDLYRRVFPDGESGFYSEMIFLLAIALGLLLMSGW